MTRILIHPGEHLADELQALGMSANELAKELGVPTNRLTQIIKGKRGIAVNGVTPWPVVRDRAGYLDEPAKKLRAETGGG